MWVEKARYYRDATMDMQQEQWRGVHYEIDSKLEKLVRAKAYDKINEN